MFFNWEEVYTTFNMEMFFKAKNLLAENNIDFKSKTSDDNIRVSLNNMRGTDFLLSRFGSANVCYYIYVKKKDAHEAARLLAGLRERH